MAKDIAPVVTGTAPLAFLWETLDPFLFCAHHVDKYPAGNKDMGPVGSLAGRQMGSDFAGKDGWNMYHGSKVTDPCACATYRASSVHFALLVCMLSRKKESADYPGGTTEL